MAAGPPLFRRMAAALTVDGAPVLAAGRHRLPLRLLAERSVVAGHEALAGRRVVLRTDSPLAAAAALASLDGLAARLVLCPPDLDGERLAAAAAIAGAEAVVSDQAGTELQHLPHHRIDLDAPFARALPAAPLATEWALFTSGTSGTPKLVVHDLDRLTGAIRPSPDAQAVVWATFYDVRRYGGLQMLLRALAGGSSLHMADPQEALGDFLQRLGAAGVTHLAGTPSHWRRALMSPALAAVSPRYVRLSGEIADQAVLDALRARFPQAAVGHAYASTEAGVGFEVADGREGFPAAFLDGAGGVEMRVVDGALRLRSARAARRYLGDDGPALHDADGFVDTGDLVELRGDRYHFLGRRSGVINVGGLKISPEEVEAVINACPGVRMSRVSGRANPLTGALVAAEVVLDGTLDAAAARESILARCRSDLDRYKTPASLRFVDALSMSAGGKLERRIA